MSDYRVKITIRNDGVELKGMHARGGGFKERGIKG